MKIFLKIKNNVVYSILIHGVPGKSKGFDEVIIDNNRLPQVFLYLLYVSVAIKENRKAIPKEVAREILSLEKEIN
jgi:hypothetical protein